MLEEQQQKHGSLRAEHWCTVAAFTFVSRMHTSLETVKKPGSYHAEIRYEILEISAVLSGSVSKLIRATLLRTAAADIIPGQTHGEMLMKFVPTCDKTSCLLLASAIFIT